MTAMQILTYDSTITVKYNEKRGKANVIINTVFSIVMLCIRHHYQYQKFLIAYGINISHLMFIIISKLLT